MSRGQWILLVLLVLQGGLLLIVAAPWSTGAGIDGTRVLVRELGTVEPARIEIVEGDVTLSLQQQDGRWRIEQADGYPADASKVERLIGDLEQIEVRRPVVSGSRYHEALKVTVDDNERRLRLWGSPDGEPAVELLIGSSPNYGVQHVRRRDEDRVYEVRGLSPWDLRADAGSWIDTTLLEVAAADVVSLRITHGAEGFGLSREDGSEWHRSDGEAPVDPAKVDRFLETIEGLRVSEPAGPAGPAEQRASFGLDEPAAVLELVHRPAENATETVTLRIGRALDDDSGKRYAWVDGAEYAVVLSKWDAERVVDQRLESFAPDDDGDG
ncbi:MAG TPA: DUF4340 domain-containing protein [Candidatus Polarisedimenticolaceae bacterium]|nr:DUF4340 domain-containing protein [Candidatus Polarisedimenticolaceae bacterium]